MVVYMKHLLRCVLVCMGSLAIAENRMGQKDERQEAFGVRMRAARTSTLARAPHAMGYYGYPDANPDESNPALNYANSYTKLFEHNNVDSTVTASGAASFASLVKAEQTGLQTYFNAMQFTPGCQRLQINPQAGFAFSLQGMDSSLFSMPSFPLLSDAWMGAEILEDYLMMICRDVNFEDYGTGLHTDYDAFHGGGSITNRAAAVLQDLGSNYHGPRNSDGFVDASVLFRGMTAGDQVGPYVSQFMWQRIFSLFPSGCSGFTATLIGVQNLDQDVISVPQLYPIVSTREFGVTWDNFIALQNGLIPEVYTSSDYGPGHRYVINGRDIGSLDHADTPYGYYTNALAVLAYHGFPISPYFPYANGTITKESAGFDMGVPDAFTMVGNVCAEAFKAAWAQKWRVFRRARPEAICGLVHHAKESGTNPYNLHSNIFGIHAGVDVLAWARYHNEQQQPVNPLNSTYLLAQMFPEGSPTHPAYPSGHSVVAGACTTVIKAIFDTDVKLNTRLTPVKPDPSDPTKLIPLDGEGEDEMTVGSELDKLASTVAIGRDFAGVHWRSDGDAGLLLGEEVGICYLQDQARKYTEVGFTGFRLTKRDGTRVIITGDSVIAQ